MKTTPLPFKKKLALKLFNRYRANEKSTHILNYLFWECTLRCNLSCLHCGSDCKKEAVVWICSFFNSGFMNDHIHYRLS